MKRLSLAGVVLCCYSNLVFSLDLEESIYSKESTEINSWNYSKQETHSAAWIDMHGGHVYSLGLKCENHKLKHIIALTDLAFPETSVVTVTAKIHGGYAHTYRYRVEAMDSPHLVRKANGEEILIQEMMSSEKLTLTYFEGKELITVDFPLYGASTPINNVLKDCQ